jgi:FixJ family two-component response regulator
LAGEHVNAPTEKVLSELRSLRAPLIPREQEVLALVVSRLMNKQIAAEIGLAELTVKIHRGHIMKKRGEVIADLVRMAEMLGCGPSFAMDWFR